MVKLSFLASALFLCVLLLTGCEQKTEDAGQELNADTSAAHEPMPETPEIEEAAIPELTGRWTGTFDQRSATLNITGQTENEFSGTLTVAYRDPLTKAVSGIINKDDLTFTMTDTQHSRYRGNYSGKITDDVKMSGTFTMNLDKKNYSFSLTKR